MRRITLALILALCLPAAASGAMRIKAGDRSVIKIGKFKPGKDASVAAAVRAFGEATGQRASDGLCTVRWEELGLKIAFAGAGGGSACKQGTAQSFSADGEQFATSQGLRVRGSARAVRKAHPNAQRHRSSFWLRTAGSAGEEGGAYPILQAEFGGGRVTGFKGFIGAPVS